MVVLTTLIVVGVIYRKAGASLGWYDEVAEVLLAWLTYYGAALAALKRDHIGFSGLINAVKPPVRVLLLVLSEVLVFGFFILLGWIGLEVLSALEGDTLVSLPWVSIQFTQSVIPISALLFIIAEAMSLPEVWQKARGVG
jgi:TRAP-type C4-dicarboxylate transport system permease small subunit